MTAEAAGVVWVNDDDAPNCMHCRCAFNFFTRKHHCRKCGRIFCNECSSKKAVLKQGGTPVRVCIICIQGSSKKEHISSEALHSLGLCFSHLGPRELTTLRLVCSSILAVVNPILEKHERVAFRIPTGKKIATLSPKSLIIYSHISLLSSITYLMVIVFNEDHFNQLLTSLPPTLLELKCKHFNNPPSLTDDENFNIPSKSLSMVDILSPGVAIPSFLRFTKSNLPPLPASLKVLTLPTYFNSSLDQLPGSLTHLITGQEFDLSVDYLPSTLTHLVTGLQFNQNIERLPATLIYFKTLDQFNKSVDNLPKNLLYLTLGHKFNQNVDNLPPTLTHLTFGEDFNNQIDNLPATLTHLITGNSFDKGVDNLPVSLTYLKTGSLFNKPVDNLPPTLTYFITGNSFNQPVENLPTTLTHLITGDRFNKPIAKLPPTLICFTTSRDFNQPIDDLSTAITHHRVVLGGKSVVSNRPNCPCGRWEVNPNYT